MSVFVSVDELRSNLERSNVDQIIQEITRRLAQGAPVQVRVDINYANIDLHFAAPRQHQGGGGSRPLTAQEQEIVDLWIGLELNQQTINPRGLSTFLNGLAQYVRSKGLAA